MTLLRKRQLANITNPAIAVLNHASSFLAWSQAKCRLAESRLASFRRNLIYQSNPEDIFIVTYPKSGTTWMQMILYQLMTHGCMELEHIRLFSPFLERDLGQIFTSGDLSRVPPPRVFKSHLPYSLIPKGSGRYVYVVRDGLDVAVSYYYYKLNHNAFEGTFDQFFRQFMTGGLAPCRWFEHVAGWVRNRSKLNMLIVRYEDLLLNLHSSVARVAEFCGIHVQSDQWPRILSRSSFDFMRRNENKLTPMPIPDVNRAESYFMRKGKAGEWKTHIDQTMLRTFNVEFDRSLRDSVFNAYRHLEEELGRH